MFEFTDGTPVYQTPIAGNGWTIHPHAGGGFETYVYLRRILEPEDFMEISENCDDDFDPLLPWSTENDV